MIKTNHHKRLKGFTIIELLTVMAISSIVMLIGVTLFTNVETIFSEHIKTQQEDYDLNNLYVDLQRQFFISDSIKLSSEDGIHVFNNERINDIRFYSDELVLNGKSIQLFNLESKFKSLYSSSEFIHQLNLDFEFDGMPFQWQFKKEYGISKIIYK